VIDRLQDREHVARFIPNPILPVSFLHFDRAIAVFDFGSQYSELIVRRIRELGYQALLYQPGQLTEVGHPAAVILSGGPRRTTEPGAPDIDFDRLREFGVPILRDLLRHAAAQFEVRRTHSSPDDRESMVRPCSGPSPRTD